MNIDQIVALAAQGESETLEYKETTVWRREAAMTVCAFLNQGGGQVLFGAPVLTQGKQVSERTTEELSAELRRIDVPALATDERVSVAANRDVIVVSTSQWASRPYAYRGNAYRRVGNTIELGMSADEYNRMRCEQMQCEQRLRKPTRRRMIRLRPRLSEKNRRTVEEAVLRGRLEEPFSLGITQDTLVFYPCLTVMATAAAGMLWAVTLLYAVLLLFRQRQAAFRILRCQAATRTLLAVDLGLLFNGPTDPSPSRLAIGSGIALATILGVAFDWSATQFETTRFVPVLGDDADGWHGGKHRR